MDEAPKWTLADEAMRWLNEVELVQGGSNGPTIKLRAAIAAMNTEVQQLRTTVAAPRDDECEAVIACLGDDAALLRNDNLDCEIAANMDTAADMMEKLREFRHEAVRALQAVLAVADRDTVEFDMARASISKATGCAA